MLLIIVATGNHFFVDAALGGLVVAAGSRLAALGARPPQSPSRCSFERIGSGRRATWPKPPESFLLGRPKPRLAAGGVCVSGRRRRRPAPQAGEAPVPQDTWTPHFAGAGDRGGWS